MSTGFIAGNEGRARYARLAQSLLERIEGGEYRVGACLPTEFELCRQFGVSRTTVREAIRRLAGMGLLSAKPGVGTVVRARHVRPRFVHTVESVSDIFQYARTSSKPKLLHAAEVTAGEEEAKLLLCKPGQRWTKFETLRFFADEPVPMAHSQIYVDPAFGGVVKRVALRNVPTYTLLESEYGERVVEVQQEFNAVQVRGKRAALLKVGSGSAALQVIRHYFAERSRLLMVSISLYPAGRFSYAMRFRYHQD